MSIWKAEPKAIKTGARTVSPDIENCMMALSNRLIAELNERDCSMRVLARKCGLTGEEIWKIINKRPVGIKLATIFKLSKGLNVRVSALIADMEGGD